MSSQIALGAEGPVGNEHAGHGHSHQDVSDVDVPTTCTPTSDGHGQEHEAVASHRQHRHRKEVVQPRRGGRHGTRTFFDSAVEFDTTPLAVSRAIVKGQ